MDKGKISGTTDGRQAVLQSVYLTLNVERYAYPIYSRNYGMELADLIGQPADYVMSEVKRRIAEALEQDDRITGVGDWNFETSKNGVYVSFIVHTVYGELEVSKEVMI